MYYDVTMPDRTTPQGEIVTTVLADDLAIYEGKDVVVAAKVEGESIDIAGRCLKANPGAMVVKAKSKTHLLERREILDVEVVDNTKPKKLMVRWISKATTDSVRQHLADRHGYQMADIPDDAGEAIKLHSVIDHDRLGHRHGTKPKRVRKMNTSPDEVASRAATLQAAEPHNPQANADTSLDYDEDCDHPDIECEGNCSCECEGCFAHNNQE